MAQLSPEQHAEFYSRSYDASVPDWPGELAFYKGIAAEALAGGGTLLEIACGTGRIAARLAQDGLGVLGLDISPYMLAAARLKTEGLPNARWVQGDMRSFDLDETFPAVIIPGHSFQNLNTTSDQISCLECIRRHLLPGGLVVVHLDHQDFAWLGNLVSQVEPRSELVGHLELPGENRHFRTFRAWSFEPSTQTAVSRTTWEEIDQNETVVQRLQAPPVRLHCLFRFEMENLLSRGGFAVEAIYGDFSRGPLLDHSTEAIWLARRPI